MTNYYMTEKEQQFLTVAHIDKNQWHNWGNGLDPAYVYFDFIDLTDAGMGIMEAKGLLSSLFEKNIIEVIEEYKDMNVFNRGQYLIHLPRSFALGCQGWRLYKRRLHNAVNRIERAN